MHVTLTLLGLAQAKLYKAAPWIYFRNAEPELAAWYSVINTSPSHPITQGLKKGTTGQFYTLDSNIDPKKDGVPSVIEIDVTVLYGPIKGLERERGSTYLVILHNYAMGESPFEIAIVELCTENFTQGPLLEPADGSPIRKVPLKMANESVGKWVDTKKGGLIDGVAEDLDFYPAYVYSPKNVYMMTDLEIETLMAKYKALELEEFTAVKHPKSLETSGTSSGTSRNEEDGGDQQGNTKSALGNIEGGGKARDDILGPSSNPVLQKGKNDNVEAVATCNIDLSMRHTANTATAADIADKSYEIAENFSLTMPRPTSQQKGSVASALSDMVEVAKHEALLTLSPELTSAFWSELVPLYHQKAYDVTAMWIKVEYTKGEDIPRWRLWARFFVWLFSSRLPPAPSATSPADPAMLQQHSTAIANLNDPSLAAVQTSIDNITSWLDTGDSIEAILEEILVNAVPGFYLGPYAKDLDINDGVLGDEIRSLLEEQCPPQSHESCESAANFQDDLLPWMMPNGVSGISRNMAWQYGGGNSLAGCHREDANLHFVHVMPKLRMDFSELIQKRPPLEAAVARLAMDPRLQCKMWLFMRSRATTDVIALNKEMATLDTDIPDLLIDSAVGDAMFKEKCYVIRPDWARVNGWQVVYMRPGDVICSDYPHSVCGGTSVMSVAWNTCQIESLVRYLVASYELSAYRRQQRQALVAMDLKQLDFSMKKKSLTGEGIEIAHPLMSLPLVGSVGESFVQDIAATVYKNSSCLSASAKFVHDVLLNSRRVILANEQSERGRLKLSCIPELPHELSHLLAAKIAVTTIRCFSCLMPLGDTLFFLSKMDCKAGKYICGHCAESKFDACLKKARQGGSSSRCLDIGEMYAFPLRNVPIR